MKNSFFIYVIGITTFLSCSKSLISDSLKYQKNLKEEFENPKNYTLERR